MARHSDCAEAEIELSVTGDCLRLFMRDNVRGFDAARASEGHGLMSMRDRARDIRGRLTLSSQPGHGATIQLEVPLDRHWHEAD
jgi:signal transduction histidine kinase